ncbi:MAG: sugar phosphate isomerase/epimerase family protein [Anaerolineae bacterium]
MHISIATANFYYLPFDNALDIIAGAGYTEVELALYWERGRWAMAQHLRDISAQQTARAIAQAGLHVSSIHDGGGVLHAAHTIEGFINPQLDALLDELGYAPQTIVLHSPHVEGSYDQTWWYSIADTIARAALRYQSPETAVTLENMPPFSGFTMSLLTPRELHDYAAEYGLGVTLDTTHYAQMGTDIVEAAHCLGDRVRTIHLSDYQDGRTHLFPGDGVLDFPGFFKALTFSNLQAITLECSAGFKDEDVRQLDRTAMTSRLRLAGERLRGWLPFTNPDAAV